MTTKPGASFTTTGCLAEPLRERDRRIDGRVVGLLAAHDLDQMHDRDRVEEMHADEGVRESCRRGEPGNRDGRRVGGHDGIVPRHRIDALQDRNLQRLALRRRFDHEVATAQRTVVRGAAQPTERCAPVAGGELLLS